MKKLVLLIARMGPGLVQAAPCESASAAQEAHRMGMNYRNGAGVAQDAARALRWMKKAADCQLPAAMFTLSNMLAAGEGAVPDAAQARHWLEAAAALGYPEALQQLALSEPDPRKAELLMRQAAHALQHR